jgi:glyoxylase-like metal-dependent hydrolase (beta-lactamase superfamily II)
MAAKIDQMTKDLYLLTLEPPLPGFEAFICSWVHKREPFFIVDVGPAVTANALIEALRALDIERLDFILLTHIHLDHAGAIGEVARVFPDTPIVCHPAGIPHLIDPTNLWRGTLKTLGRTGEVYGPLQPVAPDRLQDAATFGPAGIAPLLTPGHSQHHVSYHTTRYLFAGEAGGVYWISPRGRIYLRPATPPRFFFDIYRQSVDLLIAHEPTTMCYGHYGITNAAVARLREHRDQLTRWRRVIAAEMAGPKQDDFLRHCLDRLLQEDPLLAGYHEMDPLVQQREKGFLLNSISGFAGYLQAVADQA